MKALTEPLGPLVGEHLCHLSLLQDLVVHMANRNVRTRCLLLLAAVASRLYQCRDVLVSRRDGSSVAGGFPVNTRGDSAAHRALGASCPAGVWAQSCTRLGFSCGCSFATTHFNVIHRGRREAAECGTQIWCFCTGKVSHNLFLVIWINTGSKNS